MSIMAEETMVSATENLVRAGAPLESIAKIKTAPVSVVDQNLFNVLSGYAGYIVPVVMPVILQAVLLMSITMALGDWISARPLGGLARKLYASPAGFAALFGAFWFFGMLWIGYALGIDFALFDFSSMRNPAASLILMALFYRRRRLLRACGDVPTQLQRLLRAVSRGDLGALGISLGSRLPGLGFAVAC